MSTATDAQLKKINLDKLLTTPEVYGRIYRTYCVETYRFVTITARKKLANNVSGGKPRT